MEWAASKAGLIPENAEDAMAMRMVVGKIYSVNQIIQLKFRNIAVPLSSQVYFILTGIFIPHYRI